MKTVNHIEDMQTKPTHRRPQTASLKLKLELFLSNNVDDNFLQLYLIILFPNS